MMISDFMILDLLSLKGENAGKAGYLKHFPHDLIHVLYFHAALSAHGLMSGKKDGRPAEEM